VEFAAAGPWASAIIALAALFRPEITRLYWRQRSAIDVHLAGVGPIEIGFSNFGATVGLQGTLRAIGRDQFITMGQLTIERLADHLQHDFEWAVFRPQVLMSAPQQGIEIAAGFALPVAAPRRFNMQFHDTGTQQRMKPPLAEIQRLWLEYLQENSIILVNLAPNQIRTTYDAFHQAKQPAISTQFQTLEQQFYWIEGAYRLTLNLTTSRPDRRISFAYTYQLLETESKLLRLNLVGCLLVACNVPDITFNFSFPKIGPAGT